MSKPRFNSRYGLFSVALAAALLLSACGKSPEDAAIDVCERGLAERLGERKFAINREAMLASAKRPEGGDIIEFNAAVTLDVGAPNQSDQPILCRAQFDPANPKAEPTLLYIQANW